MTELTSISPHDGTELGSVPRTDRVALDVILASARAASAQLADATAQQRAGWMGLVADAIDGHVQELVGIAHAETGLPIPRLVGELARTTSQLRFLASVAREGSVFAATIDHADAAWQPAPRPDIRSIRVGIGPVLVFAASNFPFAFSVLGGDTASAWAAGCPVVLKAHPGHLLLSRAVTRIATAALEAANAPAGMLATIYGLEVGPQALVDERIAASAFTGSLHGGRALFDIAARRPNPIPFFGELGSVNPVVVTESVSAAQGQVIAEGLVQSFLLGAGQFCTKPGLVLVPEGSAIPALVADAVARQPAQLMLSHELRDRFDRAVAQLHRHTDVRLLAAGQRGENEPGAWTAASVAVTSADRLARNLDEMAEECFGPSILVVRYRDDHDLTTIMAALPGSLTGTIHRSPSEDVTNLVRMLAPKVGRVILDEWPTGVAVTWAQFHGGPYPATTDVRFTSVGAAAIYRFLRPVTFQNMSQEALPVELRDDAAGVRRVDGALRGLLR